MKVKFFNYSGKRRGIGTVFYNPSCAAKFKVIEIDKSESRFVSNGMIHFCTVWTVTLQGDDGEKVTVDSSHMDGYFDCQSASNVIALEMITTNNKIRELKDKFKRLNGLFKEVPTKPKATKKKGLDHATLD